MPTDHKRINGPEASVSYDTYVQAQDEAVKFDCTKQRSDGRANDEPRKIFLKTGIVTQAKGSAYIEMGNTKVICSVFDPREVPNKNGYCVRGELYCEFRFASFSSVRRKQHQPDVEQKEYNLILQRALEPAVCLHEFPNFQVDVYAMVLDNDGSSLAAAIMAASLALANAGVPMFGLVTATTLGISGDTILLDPTDAEEAYCNNFTKIYKKSDIPNHGLLMQAALPQHGQISEFFVVGSMSIESITKAIEILQEANKAICPVLQQCLVKSVVKSFRRLNYEDKNVN